MTSAQLTFAFELAIIIFALYLLVRRLARLGSLVQNQPPFYVEEPRPDPRRDPDEPVTIAWFKLTEEAEMWAETLRQAGIEATIIGGIRTGPQMQVRYEDAHRAVEMLRLHLRGLN